MPKGAYVGMPIPALMADGRYATPNRNLSADGAVWHLRAALNVAALACRGPESAQVVADYNTLLTAQKEMILVPYLLVGLYLIKVVKGQQKPWALAVGVGASLYGIWLLYASGPLHLFTSVVLYTPGILLFIFARRRGHEVALKPVERVAMMLIVAATLPAMWKLLA
jgi:hypothetical protein